MVEDYKCDLTYLSFYGDTPAECLLKASRWFSEHQNENVKDGLAFYDDGIVSDWGIPASEDSGCYKNRFVFGIGFQKGLDKVC